MPNDKQIQPDGQEAKDKLIATMLEALQDVVYRLDVHISNGKAVHLDILARDKANAAINDAQMLIMPALKIGQIWQDASPQLKRFERKVRIEEIRSLDMPKGILVKDVVTDRKTWASASRFNGKRGGYKLVKEKTE